MPTFLQKMVPFEEVPLSMDTIFEYRPFPDFYINYTGVWREWGVNGRIIAEHELTNSNKNGGSKYYFDDGSLGELIQYKNGKKSGQYISFYNNGMIYFQGEYINNRHTGIWTKRSLAGKLLNKYDTAKKSELNNLIKGYQALHPHSHGTVVCE